MAHFEPGLLDKLLDTDQGAYTSSVMRSFSVEEIKSLVARDLEGLLNTRRGLDEEALKDFPECLQSMATYGINDFSGLSLASFDDREFICASIQNAIARHEKRLKDVRVKLEMGSQTNTNVLYFVITATLVIPGLRELVNFDALLKPTTLQYSVTNGAVKRKNT